MLMAAFLLIGDANAQEDLYLNFDCSDIPSTSVMALVT